MRYFTRYFDADEKQIAFGGGLTEESSVKEADQMLAKKKHAVPLYRELHKGEGFCMALVKSEMVCTTRSTQLNQ